MSSRSSPRWAAGYDAQLRRAPSGDPIGYKVGRRGDVNAAGESIHHSGSKLAPDLSLLKLAVRWEGRPADVAGSAMVAARRAVERARVVTRAGGDEVAEIAHATADVLVALRDWPDLAEAADLFDRAARAPRRVVARPSAASLGLRRAARQLIRQRSVAGDGELGGLVALVLALVALVREIAAWQRERGRSHQAAAAIACATNLEDWSGRPHGEQPAPRRGAPSRRQVHRMSSVDLSGHVGAT